MNSLRSLFAVSIFLLVVGTSLLVIGVIFVIVSFIPIPEVVMVSRAVEETSYEYRTVRETWLNEVFVVGAGEAKAYCGSFSSGTKLIISVNVRGGGNRDIDFYAMDESEWRVFKAGGTFYYYTVPSRTRVTQFTVEWYPPENRELCFVFSNEFSIITSKTVEARIDYETKRYVPVTVTRMVQVPETQYRTLSYLTGTGLVLCIVGIGTLIAYYYTRKTLLSESVHPT